MGGRDTGKCCHDDDELRLRDHSYLAPSGNPLIRPDFSSDFARLDKREQVMACVRLAKREGLDFLVLDQTRPDIEVPVVRCSELSYETGQWSIRGLRPKSKTAWGHPTYCP